MMFGLMAALGAVGVGIAVYESARLHTDARATAAFARTVQPRAAADAIAVCVPSEAQPPVGGSSPEATLRRMVRALRPETLSILQRTMPPDQFAWVARFALEEIQNPSHAAPSTPSPPPPAIYPPPPPPTDPAPPVTKGSYR